jgi:glycosyltransferase involved in cell wall biosynthesis
LKIVIPCYNEPDVLTTLHSLSACERGNFNVEIIIVVNSYLISPEAIYRQNRHTFDELTGFAQKHNTRDFYFTPVWVENLPGHQTGAGLPRKIGMDKAVDHFKKEGTPEGIIVSLDADCTVKSNYLTEIHAQFKKHKLKSATIEFHHPVEHLETENDLRKATEAYEEYLRYYRAALEYTGYPYPYYTIGSAFAVTAEAYLQVGGMGKQQAGEDFYFLQKIFPLGKTRFIDATCVFPAARLSDRVPFGTGPAIGKMIEMKQTRKRSYQVAAFSELKLFFARTDSFFKKPSEEIEKELSDLPSHLQSFLQEDDFLTKIDEINRHTAHPANFKKRFFNYFTAFKILKYLNSVHPYPYEWVDVSESLTILAPSSRSTISTKTVSSGSRDSIRSGHSIKQRAPLSK